MGEGKIGCVGFAYPEVELVGGDDDGKIGPVFNLRKDRVAIHALSLAGWPIFLQGPGHGGCRDHKTGTCASCSISWPSSSGSPSGRWGLRRQTRIDANPLRNRAQKNFAPGADAKFWEKGLSEVSDY